MKLNWFDQLSLDLQHLNWIRTDHKSVDWIDWKWISNLIKWNWDERDDESFVHSRVLYVCVSLMRNRISQSHFTIAWITLLWTNTNAQLSICNWRCYFVDKLFCFNSIRGSHKQTISSFWSFDHLINWINLFKGEKLYCLWISLNEMMRKIKWQTIVSQLKV